jgi:predicted transcriptional regulator
LNIKGRLEEKKFNLINQYVINRAYYGMFGRNTVFPKEVIDNVIPTLDRLVKSGKIKRKMLDSVKIAIYISESQSALMLPNMRDEVDLNILLVGDDPLFNDWCLDLFNYFWERA